MTIDALTLQVLDPDADGWQEVVLVTGSEGDTLGHLQVVPGTESGPHTWFDVRVPVDGDQVTRRFVGIEFAQAALLLRALDPRNAEKVYGW